MSIDVGVDRVPPDCQVLIDDRPVHISSQEFNAGAPAATEPVAISWGRDSTVDQPDTGTATFTVLQRVPSPDPILQTVHVGAPVEIWSQAVVPPLAGNLIRDPDFNTAPNGPLNPSRWAQKISAQPEQLLGTNLAPDPSLTQVDQFSPGGGAALEPDTSWSMFGDSSLRVTNPDGGNGAGAYVINVDGGPTLHVDLLEGHTYIASAYVHIPETLNGSGAVMAITWNPSDGSDTQYSYAYSDTIPDAGDHRLLFTWTVPANTENMSIRLLVRGGAGQYAMWDGLLVEEGSELGDYFDGDTSPTGDTHYRWTGNPNSSASEKYIPAFDPADLTVSVERFAGRRCVVMRRPGSYDWRASIVFPPAPYVPDGTNPQAWDLIPQLLPGQTGEVSIWARLPRGIVGGLIAAYAADPYRSEAVAGWCDVDGGSLAGDGQWHKLTATVRLPLDFNGGGAWILPGLVGGGADPTTWADKGDQTWTDQGNTWDELNAAAAAHPVSLQAEPSLRRVLVWSGEITSAVGQAHSDHSIAVAVTASDLGAPIANDNIGDEPWQAEPAGTRMDRIVALSRSKPTLTVDPDLQDTQVSYRDVDSQPVQGLLQDLAQTVNGVLWAATHAVNGPYLWVEDTDQRSAVLVFVKPDDGPVEVTERAGRDVTKLSAGDLLRDPVQWTTDVATVITSVSVSWLEQVPPAEGEQATTTEHTATVRDEDLIKRYGLRSMSVSTELTSQTDAESLAALLLAQQSRRGDWIVSGLSVDSAWLDRDLDGAHYADRLTATLNLLDGTRRLGAAVTITDPPEYAPRGVIRSAYVEGGQYTFSGGRWQLALTVSPAGGQGSGATWEQLPADWIWTDMGDITWVDAAGVAAPETEGI